MSTRKIVTLRGGRGRGKNARRARQNTVRQPTLLGYVFAAGKLAFCSTARCQGKVGVTGEGFGKEMRSRRDFSLPSPLQVKEFGKSRVPLHIATPLMLMRRRKLLC